MSRDGFLERWSRRKLSGGKVQESEPQRAEAPSGDAAAGDAAARDAAGGDAAGSEEPEEILDKAELARLPPLESFTVKTDLAPFLRKGVPHGLRNAALRKMWMLDPAIRDHKDFAVDYAWDWNTPGGVPGNSGTISTESLKRMMESLNPGPTEAVAAAPVPAEESESATPEAHAPRSEPEPPVQTAQEPGKEDVSEPQQAARRSDRTVRPRRHGGAAPV